MSRTHFWTILIGADPTSFRAGDKETLLPTLKQLQRRHPEAVIKWFERGQLFETPLEAEQARLRAEQEKRPRDWRPGGDHRDPRAKYDVSRDEKRRRFKMRARRDRMERPDAPPAGGDTRARRPAPARDSNRRPSPSRPSSPPGARDRRPASRGPKKRQE